MLYFNSFYDRVSTMTAIQTVSHRLRSTPTNGHRSQVHGARSSLTVTHPSANRGRRCLTSVNVPLSYSLVRHRVRLIVIRQVTPPYLIDLRNSVFAKPTLLCTAAVKLHHPFCLSPTQFTTTGFFSNYVLITVRTMQ